MPSPQFSSGPNSPTTVANDASAGSAAWTNPDRAATSNNSYATYTGGDGILSNYLKATDFGFSIPLNAIVRGVFVEVEWKMNANFPTAYGNFTDRVLVVGGTIQSAVDLSDDLEDGTPNGTEAYRSCGSQSDTASLNLRGSDVNASNFGFALTFTPTVGTLSIDHIRMTIYYDLPSPMAIFP